MKTLFILGVFIYWCWAGHGGLASASGAVHSISAVLGLATHAATHLCNSAPALRSAAPSVPRATLPVGSHWNWATPRLQLAA